MFDKIKKFSAVIFLTLLIWAWAYLALEQTIPASGTLSIAPSLHDLLVTFEDQQTPVNLQLTLKGPPAKVTELRRRIREEGEQLEFFYNADVEGHSEPDVYQLEVAPFLNASDKMKELGISVESCTPARIDVKVEKLVKKDVGVQVLDEYGGPLVAEQIEPAIIQMFVRSDWSGRATVMLTASAIERARKEPISEKPYIELEPGRRTFAKDPVQIKLPATESPLKDQTISPLRRLGYIFSQSLQGKYTVEWINQDEFRTFNFKASERALKAYQDMRYQILVEVRDGDENSEGNVHRAVIYNFPEEFVRKQEIQLVSPPGEAEFKLIPVAPQPD